MLKVGPAGWSYADWEGTVYPTRKLQVFDPLQYLSEYFDTLEINSTFYRMPHAATAEGWVKKVAANFLLRVHRTVERELGIAISAGTDEGFGGSHAHRHRGGLRLIFGRIGIADRKGEKRDARAA
ncbi:MAG: DUF72 domain-containing protein [Nitrospinae bacterium]|nr:DUF72 domain-containing protein [Nitrospinota bacterium]